MNTDQQEQQVWAMTPRRPEAEASLRSSLPLQEINLQLLAQRGIDHPDQARTFLHPDISNLADPYLMEDMKIAVDRIQQAIQHHEPILVHGDYDVDGITGTALLTRLFKLVHADVRAFVPHRIDDGYSLQKRNIKRFAEEGIKVLITVDCGATNHEEIAFANTLGIDVIITDHHSLRKELPPALAILCPNRDGTAYPFPFLCGCGAAFKLATALADTLSLRKKQSPEIEAFLHTALGFVCIGTIADVVPLTDENRILVSRGLDALLHSPSPGLRALLQGAGLESGHTIRVTDISFRVSPKINAAGRMGSPTAALDLLVCDDTTQAYELEKVLTVANDKRREVEKIMQLQAREKMQDWDFETNPFIVLSDEGWHPGVIGILASRISKEFHRPAVMFAIHEGVAKGSGRTVEGFHLFDAMQSAESHMMGFGGHANAAGCEMQADRIADFHTTVNEFTHHWLQDNKFIPSLKIDLEVELPQLSLDTILELEHMEPFGQGNPQPIFIARNVNVAGQPRLVGAANNHLSFHASQGGTTLKCIAFQLGHALATLMRGPVDIAFAAQTSEWRGKKSVELHIKDLRPSMSP